MANVADADFILPDWLNQTFLQSALEGGLRCGSLKFYDCQFRAATSKGDNYLSQMFRVTCHFKSELKDSEAISLVIKSLPLGEGAEQFVVEGELFDKERKMLSETLPLLERTLKDIGETSKFFAEMYYHQGPPNDLLILEDLCQLGFRPANRSKGLDLRHSIMVVESLASLHASSLESIRRNPEVIETYRRTLWEQDNNKLLTKLVLEGVLTLAETVKKWKETPSQLSEILLENADLIVDNVFTAAKIRDEDTNVIVHGDTWTNNFMFRYEKDVPVALTFVDFQNTTFNSPVFDLLYFIFTSIDDNVRKNNLDLLLLSYHTRFESICNKFGYPLKFSLANLKKNFYERLAFGLGVSVVIFPVTKAEVKDTVDLNEVISGGMGDTIFQTEDFKKGMMSMLPIFLEHGLFKFK